MRISPRVLGSCAVVIGLGWAAAQEAARPRPPETPAAASSPVSTNLQQGDDSQALLDLVAKFTAAYNAGDAPALAALFTEDAEIVDEEGAAIAGREAIAKHFAATFEADPDATIHIAPNSVRKLGPDTLLEEGTAAVTSADGSDTEIARYSVVYVKRDGQWLQTLLRAERDPEPTHRERLEELAWMVGEWVNESDDEIVATTCRWSDDGHFLIREFDVKIGGEVALRGTQRIGWDPLRRQIRTWTFDSEGGFSEGFITRNGQQWLVKTSGVRSDAQPASATNIITVLGKDRVDWQISDRTISGVALPDTDEYIMVRKPPEPSH